MRAIVSGLRRARARQPHKLKYNKMWYLRCVLAPKGAGSLWIGLGLGSFYNRITQTVAAYSYF